MMQHVEVSSWETKQGSKGKQMDLLGEEKRQMETRQHKGLRFLKLLTCLPIFHFCLHALLLAALRPIARSQGIAEGESRG